MTDHEKSICKTIISGNPAQPIQVWFRPLGDKCRIQVDGIEHIPFLLEHLRKTIEFGDVKILKRKSSALCSMLIRSEPPLDHALLTNLMAEIPEFQIMLAPA